MFSNNNNNNNNNNHNHNHNHKLNNSDFFLNTLSVLEERLPQFEAAVRSAELKLNQAMMTGIHLRINYARQHLQLQIDALELLKKSIKVEQRRKTTRYGRQVEKVIVIGSKISFSMFHIFSFFAFCKIFCCFFSEKCGNKIFIKNCLVI